MKISFDLDGTYTEYPETFDDLAAMLQAAGHEVGILTARPFDDEHYEELGFVPDFEYYLGLPDGKYTETEKCLEKSVKIQQEEIDMHYDDEADLFPDYMNTVIIEIT